MPSEIPYFLVLVVTFGIQKAVIYTLKSKIGRKQAVLLRSRYTTI